jgi:hypothetical protein
VSQSAVTLLPRASSEPVLSGLITVIAQAKGFPGRLDLPC